MIVREYSEADFGRVTEMHRQSGFDYRLPTLSSQAFFSRRIIWDNESIGMAAFLRHTAEAYLICDPTWRNQAWRREALRKLSSICHDDAKQEGVKEVVAWLPPEIDQAFVNRLSKLGWGTCRDGWRTVFKGVS